jgi:hypothetical protein
MLTLFSDVHEKVLKNRDSTQVIIGEKECLKGKDGDETISVDILFHSIIIPQNHFPLFLNQLALSKDYIVPFLPDTDYDAVVEKIYGIISLKPFLTTFSTFGWEDSPSQGLKMIHVEEAEFDGKIIGKELNSIEFFGIGIKEFCKDWFLKSKWGSKIQDFGTEENDLSKKAIEYIASLRSKLNQKYIHDIYQ